MCFHAIIFSDEWIGELGYCARSLIMAVDNYGELRLYLTKYYRRGILHRGDNENI